MRCVSIVIFTAALTLSGCMDDLHNYHECVDIETARCDLRDECLRNDSPDVKKSYPDFDQDTCVAYAKEHCRTRKIGNDFDRDQADIELCITAILAFPCADVRKGNDETETLEACAFIDEPGDAGQEEESAPDGDTAADAGAG